MTVTDLKNSRVAVLGFGQEGQAICTYLVKHGVIPVVYDKKELTQWTDVNLAKLHALDLEAITGPDYIHKAARNSTLIFRSPGIKIPDTITTSLEQTGVIITSQTQWFFEHCPAKIIGVTGTKGKGTTSSLLHQILENGFVDRKIFLTGNIGKIQPLEFLEELTLDDLVVYEMSSFQLQDLKQSPHIGICLMVTSDHLDYHSDLAEYHMAKSAISAFQTDTDIMIYNTDYPASVKIGLQGLGQKWLISKSENISQGAKIDEDNELIQLIGVAEEVSTIPAKDRLLKGNHNLENIAAASLAAMLLKIPVNIICDTVKNFAGLQHRLQFVLEKNGIKYYNDSISTIPETTIAAINAFPTDSLVLILGGSEKNLNYDKLVDTIVLNSKIKQVVAMGPVGDRIVQLLNSKNYTGNISGPFYNFGDVMKAVTEQAKSGDVVLMSPAAPSFDMFNAYTERGDEFVRLVTA